MILSIYLMWYSIVRFFIESMRTDSLMIGDIKAGSLSIAETAVFEGNCKMQYDAEADFRRKIALKKRLEELRSMQEEMIKGFHDEVSMLEAEASHMKEEFESEIVGKPLLFVKIVIKF